MDRETLPATTSRGAAFRNFSDGFIVGDPEGQCSFCSELSNAKELMPKIRLKISSFIFVDQIKIINKRIRNNVRALMKCAFDDPAFLVIHKNVVSK